MTAKALRGFSMAFKKGVNREGVTNRAIHSLPGSLILDPNTILRRR